LRKYKTIYVDLKVDISGGGKNIVHVAENGQLGYDLKVTGKYRTTYPWAYQDRANALKLLIASNQ